MPVENVLAFLRGLGTRRAVPGALVLAGPQAFLREYALDRFRERCVGDGYKYRSLQVGAGQISGDLLDELQSADLFSPKRLLACRLLRTYRERTSENDDDAERSSAGSAGAIEAALITAIERPSPALRLAIVCERDTAPAKIRRAAESAGVIVNCGRPFDNQLSQYVELFARDAAVKLDASAIDTLIGRHGSDLSAIANAIARATIRADSDRPLDAVAFGESGAMRIPDLFEFADAIARGDVNEALALMGRAVETGRDPIEMLAVEIIPLLRRMLAAASLLAGRKSSAAVAGALGLPPSSTMATRAIDGARRFGLARLQTAFRRACELDENFKMGLLKERSTGITRLLLDLMAPETRLSQSGTSTRLGTIS